jgi:hypothetical protein
VVVPAYAPGSFVNYQTMLFGATAILATLLPEFNVGRLLQRLEGDRAVRSPVRSRNFDAAAPTPAMEAVSVGGLS